MHEGELFIFVYHNILQIEFAVTDLVVECIGKTGGDIKNPGTGFFQRNGLHILRDVIVLKRFAGEIRSNVIRESADDIDVENRCNCAAVQRRDGAGYIYKTAAAFFGSRIERV